MEVTTVDAARKLHLETQRIKANLAAAETALQEARTVAAMPKPNVQKIGPAELETARLSDLASQTEGKVAELEATKAGEAMALADWKTANAAAVAEVARQEAAVQFHTAALKEARRLELIAMSEEARRLQEDASAAYVQAFEMLQAAAAELEALRAVARGAYRGKLNDENGMADLGAIDINGGTFDVPALGVLNSYGRKAERGDTVKGNAVVHKDELLKAASRRAEEIMNAMKGRTK